MMRTLLPFTVALLVSCGGSTENEGTDAGAGAGGSAAAGGSGGTAASGGAGGSGAMGGSGVGGSGVGGSGVGGTSGSGPVAGECKTDDDCELGSDCCNCLAAPKGKLSMPYCPPNPCFADTCSAKQVNQARCVAGQCILGYDCDGSKVFCNALPPTCAQGQLPRVVNGCWGECVSADQCEFVPDCFGCPNGTVCVVYDDWSPSHHCVTPPAGCSADCDCLGKLLCIDGYDACGQAYDGSAIHCACPAC